MIERLTPFLFTCDRCEEHQNVVTDRSQDEAVARMRAQGWHIDGQEASYSRVDKDTKNVIRDTMTVYDTVYCPNCAEEGSR